MSKKKNAIKYALKMQKMQYIIQLKYGVQLNFNISIDVVGY